MSKLLEHYCDPMGRITDGACARIGGSIEPPGAVGLMRRLPPEVRVELLIAKVLLAYAEVAALTNA
jgi:hypothetical protein